MTARIGPLLAAAICLATCALTGCGGARAENGAGDGPVYPTVDALTGEADVVVLAAVGAVGETEIDDGGTGDGAGVEVTFHDVVVHEVLSGRATTVQAGDVLPVAVGEGTTELSEGDEMVLFLDQLASDEAPGIETEDLFYVIIGGSNGAFDVQDGAVIARSELVHGLADASEHSGAPFTTSLGDLRSFFTAR